MNICTDNVTTQLYRINSPRICTIEYRTSYPVGVNDRGCFLSTFVTFALLGVAVIDLTQWNVLCAVYVRLNTHSNWVQFSIFHGAVCVMVCTVDWGVENGISFTKPCISFYRYPNYSLHYSFPSYSNLTLMGTFLTPSQAILT